MSAVFNSDRPSCFTSSHRRYNPLSGDWVVVSPRRIDRPWSGETEPSKHVTNEISNEGEGPTENPLSPGARRSSGVVNPPYTGIFTFRNDFPALNTESFDPAADDRHRRDSLKRNKLFAWTPAHGECSVMCFHPRSDLTLALMSHSEVLRVIQAWCDLTHEYRNDKSYRWLQIFENRGAAVGSSNMHPHCQIWACGFLPSLVERYDRNQWRYFTDNQIPLLVDYARQEEVKMGQADCRIVSHNEHWLVVVPWWACWPFETLILPRKRHVRWLDELTADERDTLTQMTQELLIRYDNLFHTEFPYSMGWYQAPLHHIGCDLLTSQDSYQKQNHWQLHALFQPPLLRSASVRKFMSGFELLAEAQRDLLPEKAAEILRQLPLVHYTLEKT